MSLILHSTSLKPTIQLTPTTITSLLSFPPLPSHTYQTDHILQILQLKPHSIIKSGTSHPIYTASLKDSKYHYNKFVLSCNTNNNNTSKPTSLSEGDYIRITRLQVIKLPKDPDIILLIKDYIDLHTHGIITESALYENAKSDVYCESGNNSNSVSSSSNTGVGITLLKELTSFTSKFTLLVKVISKSTIRNFTKKKGMLFDFYVVDTDNSTMQVICFNSIVNKFYNIITINKVYTISNGHVKNNNNSGNSSNNSKYFSSYNECQYKLILSDETTVTETTNPHDIERFPSLNQSSSSPSTHNDNKPLSFTSIHNIIHTIDFGTVINTYGIVKSLGNVIRLQTKHGEIDMKRIIITDTATTDIEVTLWRNHSNMSFTIGDVVVLLHVKVGKYKTKNISTLTESVITVNPSSQVLTQYNIHPQVNALQREFIKPNDKEIETILNKVDVFSNINSTTDNNNVNDVNAYPENETQFDTLHNVYSALLTEQSSLKTFPLFTVKATVVAFEHKYNNYYAGCPFNKCLRKVFYQQSKWKCNHCNKAYDKPQYYFSIKITIGDCSAIKTLTLFDRPASAFLGTTASQYKEYITHKNDIELDKLLKCVIDQQFVFVLQPKINKNGSNGGVTKRINVLSVRKYTPSRDNNVLLNYVKSVIGVGITNTNTN